MKASFYILFGALFTFLTATALGTLVLRSLRIRLYRLEERLLAFVTGSALLSVLVFVFCATHLVYKGVFLAAGAVALGAAIWRGDHRASTESAPPVPRLWFWVFGSIFAVFTVLYFFNAMSPEKSPDGTAYHLAFPADYYRAHSFVRITRNMYANISQGVEMLFLFAFAFGRHSAAALVHFSFLAALPWLMLCYSRRFGLPIPGAAAAIFVYCSPVIGMDGSCGYVDVALAAVLFALFYWIEIFAADRNPALLVPIGILAGFAFAAKYTAFLAVPYALGRVAWILWRDRKPVLRPAFAISAIALLFILPWLIKNYVWIGNPVTPFATEFFPNPYIHASFVQEYAKYERIYTLTSDKQIPYEITIGGTLLCGLLGPLFLLTPLSLFALKWPRGRQFLLAGGVFAALYFTNIGTRFLIPAAPFFALALALVFAQIPWLLLALTVAHAVFSWPSLMTLYCSPYAWKLETIPVAQALRIEPEDSWLGRKSVEYVIDRTLEQIVPPTGKVFSFSQIAESYTSRTVLVKYLSAPNEVLGDMLWTGIYKDFQPSRRISFRFPERTAQHIRVVQTADMRGALWSIAELHIYHAGQELPRAPQWRLTAKPNPWDVQLAFDNDPATRWRSWEAGKPGMHVDVDLGAPQSFDAVAIESSPDSEAAEPRIEALSERGEWLDIGGVPSRTDQRIAVGLRRAATEELKLRGIRYLLINYDDLAAEDYQQHAPDWGLHMLADRAYYRLYYIQ